METKTDYYERHVYTASFAAQRWPRMMGCAVLDRPRFFSPQKKILGIMGRTDRSSEILGPLKARIVGEVNRWIFGNSFFKVEYNDDQGEKTVGYVCKRFTKSEEVKLGGGGSVRAVCF